MIKLVNIQDNKNCVKNIRRLYNDAFPKNERVPFFLLKYMATKEKADLYGIYDNTEFIGLLYNVYYKDTVFVFYLAIDSKIRSKGYGSAIIDEIKLRSKNRRIILNIEEVDENSNDFEQQMRRKSFYIKNGFKESSIKTREKNVVYEMLYYGENVTYEEYSKLMQNYLGKFLFNLYYERVN